MVTLVPFFYSCHVFVIFVMAYHTHHVLPPMSYFFKEIRFCHTCQIFYTNFSSFVTLVNFCHTCYVSSHFFKFCPVLSHFSHLVTFVTFCHTCHICHTVTFVTLLHLWWSISLTLWHNIDGHKETIQKIYICLGEIYTGKIPPPFQ